MAAFTWVVVKPAGSGPMAIRTRAKAVEVVERLTADEVATLPSRMLFWASTARTTVSWPLDSVGIATPELIVPAPTGEMTLAMAAAPADGTDESIVTDAVPGLTCDGLGAEDDDPPWQETMKNEMIKTSPAIVMP